MRLGTLLLALSAAAVVAQPLQPADEGAPAADCATGTADLRGSELHGAQGPVDVLLRLRLHDISARDAAKREAVIVGALLRAVGPDAGLQAIDLEVDQVADSAPTSPDTALREGLALLELGQRLRAGVRSPCVIVTLRVHVANGADAPALVQLLARVVSDGSLREAFAAAGLPSADPQLAEPPRIADGSGDYSAAERFDEQLDAAAQKQHEFESEEAKEAHEAWFERALEAQEEQEAELDEAAEEEADKKEERREAEADAEAEALERREEQDRERQERAQEEEEEKRERALEAQEEQEDKALEREEEQTEKQQEEDLEHDE